ncbi:MAG: hypothetical protein IKE23_07565, partial [Exiguobacterium sp.]|nr:hypothetical protein [Exiguobacterium sp.]
IDVSTLFAPMIARALIAMPVFASTTGDISTGSRVGTLFITVPRLQLNGDLNIDGSQTSASTTVLNATALSFDEYQSSTGNACAANEPKLAYMALDLSDEGNYDHVVQLVVVGGGVSGAPNTIVDCPVLLLMDNGETQPIGTYTDFIFTTDSSVATINSDTGAITIKGDGDITVAAATSVGRDDLTAVINVDATA